MKIISNKLFRSISLARSVGGGMLVSMGLAGMVSADVAASGFSIDRTNRNSVVAGYHNYYVASENFAAVMDWNGNVSTCNQGVVSAAFQNDVLRRINYYRAQVGLPSDIYFNPTYNSECQRAALMMAAQGALSHYPPSSWSCYTAAGSAAAGKSNLSLGTNNYGPNAIDSFIEDDGGHNSVVGHRRWLLFSRASEMGSGNIPDGSGHYGASAIRVIGTTLKPVQAPQAVAWPNDGYVPWNLVPNDGITYPRWSYSYRGADFSSATVTLKRGTTTIPVVKEPVPASASSTDNTIVWRPSGIPNAAPSNDTAYTVTITGIVGAPSSTVTYTVTLIDPYKVNDLPVVSGSVSPTTGSANPYSFTPTDQAGAYQMKVYESNPGTWTEGAEASPAPQVISSTTGYSLISSAFKSTGSKSFHLATPAFYSNDNFVVDRVVVPRSNSMLSIKYKRGYMTTTTQLRVELSTDDGDTYSVISSIPGTNNAGDSSFKSSNISVPAEYVGKPVMLRFRLDTGNSAFVGTASNTGIYIDDVYFTNSEELVNPSVQTLVAGASSFNFTPTVADQEYLMAVRPQLGGQWMGFGPALEVVSVAGSPVPVITSGSTAAGVQGQPFSYTITASNTPTSYGATGLPAGAAINPASGQITGQLAPGTYSGITLSATNAGGTGTAPLTINIITGYQDAVADLYPGLGLPDEDDDGDGVANFLEVAILGRNPQVRDGYAPANFSVTKVASNLVLRLKKSGVAGIAYQARGSSTLSAGTWSTSGISVVKDDASDLEVSCPVGAGERFFSIFVSQNSAPTE